ncbi:MAG: O-antigen ligase family protein [Thermodesulfobacteriota bacterium]
MSAPSVENGSSGANGFPGEMRRGPNILLILLLGYLFLFIFRPFELYDWLADFHLERTYMIGLLLCTLFFPKNGRVINPYTGALLFFFFAMCLSAFFAYDPDIAWEQTGEYSKLMIFYVVILLSVQSRRDLRIFLSAFVVVMAIYVGKSLWEFFMYGRHIIRMDTLRLLAVGRTYADPNSFAASILYSLPVAVALFRTHRGRSGRLMLAGYGLLALVALVLTGSRGGMLGFLFYLTVLWVRQRRKLLFGIMAMILVLGTWIFMPETYHERMLTMVDSSINRSATVSAHGRIKGLRNGVNLFFLAPLTGFGPGNYDRVVSRVGEYSQKKPHNLYGQILSEMGLAGLIPFCWLAVLLLLTPRMMRNQSPGFDNKAARKDFSYQMAVACQEVTLILLFMGNVSHNLFRYNWVIMAAVAGLCLQYAGERAENGAPTPASGAVTYP